MNGHKTLERFSKLMASDVPSRFLVERMDVFTKVFLPSGIKPKKLTKGDRDQAFREPQRLRWERTSPNHRTVILTGASHHIEEDAPDEIVAAIRDWWPGTSKHRAACGITWRTTGVRLTIPSTVRNVHLDGRAGIDAALVRRLIATQFPQWRDQPVTPVAIDGWDNRTYRLGTQLSVRLPTAANYASAVEKEVRWLPILAPSLPVAVPVPLATGRPGEGYPFCWSVRPWLDGRTALEQPPVDLGSFAISIAEFLLALQGIDATDGPIAGAHSFYRGASPKYYDNETRECLRALRGRIDVDAAATVWDAALATTWSRAPVWFHGDVASGNLLVRDGRLTAVIDFGTCGVGDPACDLVIAWTFFHGQSRDMFRNRMQQDADTWARARGWVLWKALISLGGDAEEAAWELNVPIIEEVIADHDRFG